MPCEVMIIRNANNYSNPDPDKDRRVCRKKGYIHRTRANPNNRHSDAERETFAFAKVTDADASEFDQYEKSWELEIDYEKIGEDLSVDGHRYRIFATNPGVSLRGAVTRDNVENWLDDWNVTIHSIASNEVVVDCVIFDMLKSKSFWDRPEGLAGMTATEFSYDQVTGEHVIDVDWSNFLPDIENRTVIAQEMQDRILQRGGSVVSYDLETQTGRFEMSRNDVLIWFRDLLFKVVRKQNMVYRCQYYVEESVVDTLVNYSNNNGGAIYEVTKAQMLTYVKSMLEKVDA